MKYKYAIIPLTDRSGMCKGIPIELLKEELNNLPPDCIVESINTKSFKGHINQVLSIKLFIEDEI